MVRIVVSAAAPTTKRTTTATKHRKFPPHGGELTRHADQPGGFQQAHNHCDLLLSRAQRRWQAGEASSRRHTRWRSHDEDTTDAHRHWPSLVSAHFASLIVFAMPVTLCFPHRLCPANCHCHASPHHTFVHSACRCPRTFLLSLAATLHSLAKARRLLLVTSLSLFCQLPRYTAPHTCPRRLNARAQKKKQYCAWHVRASHAGVHSAVMAPWFCSLVVWLALCMWHTAPTPHHTPHHTP